MPEKPITLLLVEDSEQDAEHVEDLLARAEDVPFVVVRAGSLTEALEQLVRCEVDVILLDLCLPDSSGLESFTSMQAHAPTLPVVLLTGVDSDALALMAVRNGAQDYLVKTNLTAETLVRALRYAIMRRRRAGPEVETRAAPGRVLGFLGCKGGVGTTTLACHVARDLRKRTGDPVLLADLDLHGGLVGFSMNVQTPHSILDACNNFLRLDLSYWKALVTAGEAGLDIIPAPGPAAMDHTPIAERVRYVLRFARGHYRWIVADLARFSAFSAAVLPEFTELFLVTTSEVPALFEAKRVVEQLAASGAGADRINLLWNQAPRHGLFTGADMEKAVGLPVYASVSNDTRELSKARTNGVLAADSSEFGKQIAALAARIQAAPENARAATAARFGFFHEPKVNP